MLILLEMHRHYLDENECDRNTSFHTAYLWCFFIIRLHSSVISDLEKKVQSSDMGCNDDRIVTY